MRGSKAKKLRRLAGVKTGEPVEYFGQEHTIRNREIKNVLGEVTHTYRTATHMLKRCPRVMYKMMKQASKSGTSIFS